jgi:hypothetical protein
MDAWIKAESRAALVKFTFRIVFNVREASSMKEANAHEAMKGARREYPEYGWHLVPSSTPGEFILQGTK